MHIFLLTYNLWSWWKYGNKKTGLREYNTCYLYIFIYLFILFKNPSNKRTLAYIVNEEQQNMCKKVKNIGPRIQKQYRALKQGPNYSYCRNRRHKHWHNSNRAFIEYQKAFIQPFIHRLTIFIPELVRHTYNSPKQLQNMDL